MTEGKDSGLVMRGSEERISTVGVLVVVAAAAAVLLLLAGGVGCVCVCVCAVTRPIGPVLEQASTSIGWRYGAKWGRQGKRRARGEEREVENEIGGERDQVNVNV